LGSKNLFSGGNKIAPVGIVSQLAKFGYQREAFEPEFTEFSNPEKTQDL